MKKLVLALVVSLVLVFAIGYAALAESVVKVSYDLGGTLSGSGTFGSSSQSADSGFSLGYEYSTEIADNLLAGGGIEYQLSRKSAGTGFSFIPVYGLIKYNFSQFYASGRLGYDFWTVEIVPTGVSYSGGLTYGIGFGYNINENIVIEANYLGSAEQ
jgi:opacity protein-like surface antigen